MWLDRQIPGAGAPAVLVDNRGGAYAATRHPLEHGRRRIACLAGPREVMPATDRVVGWRDALAEDGVRPSAMKVLRAAAELGLRCPQDVAIASFDGIPVTAYEVPALTTTAQPFGAMGRAALTHLLDQVAGESGPGGGVARVADDSRLVPVRG